MENDSKQKVGWRIGIEYLSLLDKIYEKQNADFQRIGNVGISKQEIVEQAIKQYYYNVMSVDDPREIKEMTQQIVDDATDVKMRNIENRIGYITRYVTKIEKSVDMILSKAFKSLEEEAEQMERESSGQVSKEEALKYLLEEYYPEIIQNQSERGNLIDEYLNSVEDEY